MSEKLSDSEWLRTLRPAPLAIVGHVQQPGRTYVELHDADRTRLRAIADRLDALEADPGGYLAVGGFVSRIKELEAENARLRIKANYADRLPFCPDHRDKVAGKSCRECEIERVQRENARLREALGTLREDHQYTLDQYDTNGPGWTSRETGAQYYSAGYVLDIARDHIARIKAALARQEGQDGPEHRPRPTEPKP